MILRYHELDGVKIFFRRSIDISIEHDYFSKQNSDRS